MKKIWDEREKLSILIQDEIENVTSSMFMKVTKLVVKNAIKRKLHY